MTNTLPDTVRLRGMLADVDEAISSARRAFDDAVMGFGDHGYETVEEADWQIENVYLKLLTIAEALGLQTLHLFIVKDIQAGKQKKNGFAESAMGPDEPYSVGLSRCRQYVMSLETLLGVLPDRSITKDLVDILRATIYPITDRRLFGYPPAREADVHDRIEGVLRCVFPDLRRKPPLHKAIKNFEPDTGLPSQGTLIEYKFAEDESGVKVLADQILADTRGYVSKDWHTFIYVIYEAHRLRAENEWTQLLRDCEVPSSTSVVVLSGEPAQSLGRRSRKQT